MIILGSDPTLDPFLVPKIKIRPNTKSTPRVILDGGIVNCVENPFGDHAVVPKVPLKNSSKKGSIKMG